MKKEKGVYRAYICTECAEDKKGRAMRRHNENFGLCKECEEKLEEIEKKNYEEYGER